MQVMSVTFRDLLAVLTIFSLLQNETDKSCLKRAEHGSKIWDQPEMTMGRFN